MKISDIQKSALIESGNIGSGHAAIALSQLMGHKIMIAVPSVEFFSLQDLEMVPNHEGKVFIQVSIGIYNDVKGVMVFIVEEPAANRLCDVVMGLPKGSTKLLGEFEQSALKEMGSILSISYLNAISDMTGLSMIGSIPEMNIGAMDSLINIVKKKHIDVRDIGDVICVRTSFIEEANRIDALMLFISTERDTAKIIKALGV